ncbi:Lar family restriction alleviation protein [Pseudomonas putida]|uniref:Lar family restriction alleviation protein n=1 Tax=Pseudomonas putida TaxID=303 RepID=UPI00390653A2
MPTENRSSNTEMVSEPLPCPFCGQQDFLIERLDSDASVVICQGLTGPHEACLARGPVGIAQNEGEEQPGRDKAVELWNARAEQHHGEPVAWRYRHAKPGMSWFFTEKPEASGCLVDGFEYEVFPLYTHAYPGEVERLREDLAKYIARANDFASKMQGAQGEAGALRDQLRVQDALLEEAYQHDIGTTLKRKIRAQHDALSASAEPSAPNDCAICRDLVNQCMECEEGEFREWADRHFAAADYRKTDSGVFIQDWMRHAYGAWCARGALASKQ